MPQFPCGHTSLIDARWCPVCEANATIAKLAAEQRSTALARTAQILAVGVIIFFVVWSNRERVPEVGAPCGPRDQSHCNDTHDRELTCIDGAYALRRCAGLCFDSLHKCGAYADLVDEKCNDNGVEKCVGKYRMRCTSHEWTVLTTCPGRCLKSAGYATHHQFGSHGSGDVDLGTHCE
jgi:hypothetical protein